MGAPAGRQLTKRYRLAHFPLRFFGRSHMPGAPPLSSSNSGPSSRRSNLGAIVCEHEYADRRGEAALLAIVAIAVDRRDERSDWSALLCRDFLERIPEWIFKAHAGHAPFDYDCSFENSRLSCLAFHETPSPSGRPLGTRYNRKIVEPRNHLSLDGRAQVAGRQIDSLDLRCDAQHRARAATRLCLTAAYPALARRPRRSSLSM